MEIIKGKQKRPYRAIVYGPPGVGKSSLATTANSPLFINLEDSLHHLDVHSTPIIKTIPELIEASVFALKTEEYKTIVYDCIDTIEDMLIKAICDKKNEESGAKKIEAITDIPYGGGTALLNAQWSKMINLFNKFSSAGKNLILVGHSQIQSFKDPAGEDYDRYTIKMSKAARDTLCAHVDDIFFMDWLKHVDTPKKSELGKRPKGKSQGERVVYTQERPAFTAKNRHDLELVIDIKEDEERFFKDLENL